jgi:hypothetical protein
VALVLPLAGWHRRRGLGGWLKRLIKPDVYAVDRSSSFDEQIPASFTVLIEVLLETLFLVELVHALVERIR